jgi:hypothetical protein
MPPEMLTYRWFAKSYGFTERQVDDEMSLEGLDWLPVIEDAADHAAEAERKRAEREARHGR